MALGENQSAPPVFGSLQEKTKIPAARFSGFMAESCLEAFEVLSFVGGGQILFLDLEAISLLSLHSFAWHQSASIHRGIIIQGFLQRVIPVLFKGLVVLGLSPEEFVRCVEIRFFVS